MRLQGSEMPKFKNNLEDAIYRKQKTTSGLYISAGEIDHSDYDSKDWSELQRDYTHMRNGNGLISTTIEILKMPVALAGWEIEGENEEVNNYVKWVLKSLYKGFNYFKRHKLLALDFGLMVHEMVVEKGIKLNGNIQNIPVFFNPIQNETIHRFLYDKYGIFQGIEHERREPEGATEFVEIAKERLDWWSYNEEFNDVRGRAILRPIRFDWDALTKITKAKVQGIQRGAGIPSIGYKGIPGEADKAVIENVGRTLCRMNEGYISYNSESMSVDLLEPKGQADTMGIIDYLTRNIMFNTLSQFLSAGIGGNGSRAATSEHKSAYEMAASVVNRQLEENIQITVDKIVKMSTYSNLPAAEWPRYRQNSISQTDLSKAAAEFKNLYDSNIVTRQRKDEEHIRDVFGLPELDSSVEIPKPNELSKKRLSKERNINTEMLEHEQNVFSLESAHEHYQTIQEKAEAVLNGAMQEYIDNIEKQLVDDRKKKMRIVTL